MATGCLVRLRTYYRWAFRPKVLFTYPWLRLTCRAVLSPGHGLSAGYGILPVHQ